jgi:sulfur-oxidizing protein SoxZ
VANHGDKVVLQGEFGTAVAKNPYLAFKFKGGAKGEKVTVAWKDNKGDSRTDEAVIA